MTRLAVPGMSSKGGLRVLLNEVVELNRDDVEAAARWLSGRVVRTPVIRSAALDRIAGTRVWLKVESLQRSGSYKVRGALLAVGRLAEQGGCSGVIAQSTGNHAVAVALAAAEHGLAATVVVPVDAPAAKMAKARRYGARIVAAGTTLEERIEEVERLHDSTGHAVIDAYDHPDVVAGQGTATLELIDEVRRQGGYLDAVVVPVGGGGGVAGACLAARDMNIAVYGVEPVGCDSLAQSLAADRRVAVPPAATLADGLRPSLVGRLPFQIVRGRIAGVTTVDDREIGQALCLALFQARILVEPSAAAGLAAALRLAGSGSFTDIGVVLTGGNVEPAVVAKLIAEYGASAGAEEDK
jgi:threonine dehydratase